MNLKKTENIVVLGLFLGLIAGIAAALLGFVAEKTKEPIKKAELAKVNQALKDVLPEFDNQPSQEIIDFTSQDAEKFKVSFYPAKKDGKLVGFAGQTITKRGYGGEIQVMAGLNPDGAIRTIIVTKQNETPGLGTVVTERKRVVTIFDILGGKKADTSKLPPNPILDQFDGHSAAATDTWPKPWSVKKDGGQINFVTGATISSRAVTDAVFRISKTFEAEKSAIMSKINSKPEAK